jgi:hypothetical protein
MRCKSDSNRDPRQPKARPAPACSRRWNHARRFTTVLVFLIAGLMASRGWADQKVMLKLDPLARGRARLTTGWSRVIVQATDSAGARNLPNAIANAGGRAGRNLSIINARVAEAPNTALAALANSPVVVRVSLDRPVFGSLERTSATVGATAVRQNLGLDGFGINIAIIDSGVGLLHDDLAGPRGPRVLGFVGYVNERTSAYDDYGHGTHVAGIIAGNGFDSAGARSGIAPAANLIALKVLDASGAGTISKSSRLSVTPSPTRRRCPRRTSCGEQPVAVGIVRSLHGPWTARRLRSAMQTPLPWSGEALWCGAARWSGAAPRFGAPAGPTQPASRYFGRQ